MSFRTSRSGGWKRPTLRMVKMNWGLLTGSALADELLGPCEPALLLRGRRFGGRRLGLGGLRRGGRRGRLGEAVEDEIDAAARGVDGEDDEVPLLTAVEDVAGPGGRRVGEVLQRDVAAGAVGEDV